MNTVHAKLALLLAVAFGVVGTALLLAAQQTFGAPRLPGLLAYVAVASIAFALLAAVCVFQLFTRRLKRLSGAIEALARGGFTAPLHVPGADPDGDEIDRLSTLVERMSEHIVGQLEQLQHSETWRRELLANISHDLRSPMASIQGYLEILLLKHGAMPLQEQRSYLEIATRQSERLGKLIRDLFQLSKLEAHEVTAQCEAFSLTELVQDVVQKAQLVAVGRGLQVHALPIARQVQVHADIAMIETVLENLIENALRHTPRGGQVLVAVEPRVERVALRVTDTGCGIADEDMAKLFERYYHVDRSEAGVAGGTGLGLAIVRRIVELHGGAIRVESRLGHGTTFAFDLPVLGEAATAARAPTPPAPR